MTECYLVQIGDRLTGHTSDPTLPLTTPARQTLLLSMTVPSMLPPARPQDPYTYSFLCPRYPHDLNPHFFQVPAQMLLPYIFTHHSLSS